MNKERNALKAGTFILLSFIAAVTAVLLIRGEGAGPTQIHTVAFSLADDLDGLTPGDNVRLGGAKVGIVRDVDIVEMDSPSPKVMVKFSIPARYTLHEGAQIGIQSSLTGLPALNISSLGTGKALSNDAAIAGSPDPKSVLIATLRRTAPHLETIAKNFETQTLPKLNDTIDSAKSVVRHVESKIDPVVSKYDGVADKTSGVMVEVRDLVGGSKSDFHETVSNLKVATASVKEKLPPLMDKVTTVVDKVDAAMTSARATLSDIEKSAANARDITASARSIIVDNRSKIDTIVKSLKVTSDNLKATIAEVRLSPWRLLYKPGPGEMGNLNLYESARQFSEGATSLDDAAAALRDAMRDPNVDKAQIQKLMDHLDESFKNFHVAEDKLWTSVKQ